VKLISCESDFRLKDLVPLPPVVAGLVPAMLLVLFRALTFGVATSPPTTLISIQSDRNPL